MSSLSQEDLDAGWDESDSGVPEGLSAEALARKSLPPNSMTVEKSPAPIESLVVPATSSVLDASSLSALADAARTQPVTAPDVPSGSLALSSMPGQPESSAEIGTATESGPIERYQAGMSDSLKVASFGSFEVVVDKSELFEVSHTLALPSAPDSAAQANAATLLDSPADTLPGESTSSFDEPTPNAQDTTASSSSDDAQQQLDFPELAPADSPVAAAVPSANGDGAALASAIAALRRETAPVAAPEVASKAEQSLATAAVPESTTGDSHSHVDESNRAAAVQTELVIEQALPVAVAAREIDGAGASRKFSAVGRSSLLRLLILSAVVVGLAAGYFARHARHSAQTTPRAAQVVPTEPKAAVAAQPAPSIASPPIAADVRPATEPASSVMAAPGESFSDAFLKHAATANSNWVDLKKRPRAADSAAPNRAATVAAGKPGNDPLTVLDQLEKARKAKKQAAERP